MADLDVGKIRKTFPILSQQHEGKPLIYFDNAASSQKPQCVIDSIRTFYETENSNVHRGVHFLSQAATEAYEGARDKIQKFINAKHREEIIFVRGTTEAINLVAHSYGRSQLQTDDEIIISAMEHHANIVPWQMLCEALGCKLKIAPISESGEIIMEDFINLFNEKTKFVSIVHISNNVGTINPVKNIIDIAHKHDVPVLIDGAQAGPHIHIDVQALDCDFYTLSGHKMYGPTGIGVLYGKKALLDKIPPYQGGGDMIKHVTFEKTIYNDLPCKFEAGTPAIAQAVGLGAAIDFLQSLDRKAILKHEETLCRYALDKLHDIPGVRVIGSANDRAAIISFVIENIHPHDIGTILDNEAIAVRTGHHCTMPLNDFYGVPATVRASFAMFNTTDEIDHFIGALHEVRKVFQA